MDIIKRKNIFRSIAKIATIALFTVLGSAYGQINFTITPQLIELELMPGARKTFKVLLVNESEKDSNRFRITMADVYETEEGSYKVIDKGTGKFSCANWITPDTMELTLARNRVKKFRLRYTLLTK